MTTTAVANGFRVCQSFLGAKIHDPKDPGADLSAMLSQVVGSTFDLMETYQDLWLQVAGSEPVMTFGFRYAVGLEPVAVNVDRMIEKFRLGVKELADMWGEVLPEGIMKELRSLDGRERELFHFSGELWSEVVYRFALAAHKRVMNKEHLLKSLTPLYIGRTASFVLEMQDSDAAAVEEKIERLCMIFEEQKSLLRDNWNP